MALIKCSNCGKDISSNAEKCIYCNTLLPKEIKTKAVITDFDTEATINRLNRSSTILSIIFIISGLIFFAVSVESEEPTLIIFCIIYIILSSIIPTFIKWLSLMLKNIYEINRKAGN